MEQIDQQLRLRHTMSKSRRMVFLLIVVLMAAGAAGAYYWWRVNRPSWHSQARREWKDAAVAEITHSAADPDWMAARRVDIADGDPMDTDSWHAPGLILMKNGEWIVYRSRCWKQKPCILDIFIGLGSDGKWYYTTYHFCFDMLCLGWGGNEAQPADIAEFVKRYSVRQGDSNSDECLNPTWPPESVKATRN